MKLLKSNGIFGFISNTFDKTSVGKSLRKYIAEKTKIEKYIDFTEVQIFEGATTYPVILILSKDKSENPEFEYRKIPHKMQGNVQIGVAQKISVKQSSLKSDSWSFQNSEIVSVMQKIKANKTVSEQFGKCYRGLLTGLNEAYFIDGETKEKLINEDSSSAQIIKKVFEGKDLSKWYSMPIEKYVLEVHNGYGEIPAIDIENYPAVKNHLDNFHPKLENRYDKGKTPYNLRNCAYQNLFEMPKIIWGNLQSSNKFSFDETGTIISAPCCMLPTDNKALLAILNSKLVWLFLTSICVVRSGGFIEVKPQYFEQIPVPNLADSKFSSSQSQLSALVDKMLSLNSDLQKKTSNFLKVAKETFNIEKPSAKLETFYDLTFEEFIKELKQKITPKIKLEWLELFEEQKAALQKLKKEIATTDRQINSLVYKLYGLTDEEIKIVESEN